MSPYLLVFDLALAVHVAAGAVGLVSFWIPVAGRKGADRHRWWGRIFARCILTAGLCAVVMSTISLGWPLETHPKLTDAALVRGLFGWMMLYLAVLTVSLVTHGLSAVELKAEHERHRRAAPLALQGLVAILAVNCAVQGWLIGQPLMMGIAVVGVASAATNLWFMLNPAPWRLQYLIEHFKASVGAGISVYTAFFAFGAVRLHPKSAFDPLLWALPLAVGLAIIIWHFAKTIRLRKPRPRQAAAARGT
jgi:cytochrome bd-type quinol oxidase subunit 2